MVDQGGRALSEREIEHLLKRIDSLVPLEESNMRMLASSKRAAYSRYTIAVVWVTGFCALWTLAYYSMLAEESSSLDYILPRLSISVGFMGTIIFLRMTERLKVQWAIVAGVALFVISRAIL